MTFARLVCELGGRRADRKDAADCWVPATRASDRKLRHVGPGAGLATGTYVLGLHAGRVIAIRLCAWHLI